MLGSVAEAEDVVQDAFLRWREVDRAAIAEPRAYLARVVSRLCLDRMKSAQHRREHYVGTWLPEPIVAAPGPRRSADDLSVALLLTLERLSPLERAAFLLHDVFDMDYAASPRRSSAARPRAASSPRARASTSARIGARFPTSRQRGRASSRTPSSSRAATGDVERRWRALLAEDAVFYSDGGGKRRAALNPIVGKDRILRFFAGSAGKRRRRLAARRAAPATINGLPGFVFETAQGTRPWRSRSPAARSSRSTRSAIPTRSATCRDCGPEGEAPCDGSRLTRGSTRASVAP